MKNYIVYFVLLCSFAIHAQETNTKRGYAAEGYDVVAYFDGQAMEGENWLFDELLTSKYVVATNQRK